MLRDDDMSNQPRTAKVLAALLVSMTVGAIVLMALGQNPPSAGPFCLASYYRLDPVEKAVACRTPLVPERWKCVEIYYSGTKAGNIKQLASLGGLENQDEIDCHFVVCNGLGGRNGQIQATESWRRQWSIILARNRYGSEKTVRICLIGNSTTAKPTDSQRRRTEALVEGLCRKWYIAPEHIYYPSDWQ